MHSRDRFFVRLPPTPCEEMTAAGSRSIWVHWGCKSACGRIDRAYVLALRTKTGTGEGDVDVPNGTR
jgi:hypothetical protein